MSKEEFFFRDESIIKDPVFEFENEMQVGTIRLLLNKFVELKNSLVYFKELSQADLLPINRVKEFLDKPIDDEHKQFSKLFTSFEFDGEIQKKIQSIESIKIELSNLLKHASNSSNKEFKLTEANYYYRNNDGGRSSVNFQDFIGLFIISLDQLKKEFEELIMKGQSK